MIAQSPGIAAWFLHEMSAAPFELPCVSRHVVLLHRTTASKLGCHRTARSLGFYSSAGYEFV